MCGEFNNLRVSTRDSDCTRDCFVTIHSILTVEIRNTQDLWYNTNFTVLFAHASNTIYSDKYAGTLTSLI